MIITKVGKVKQGANVGCNSLQPTWPCCVLKRNKFNQDNSGVKYTLLKSFKSQRLILRSKHIT